jgi:polyphosphate glucokinase
MTAVRGTHPAPSGSAIYIGCMVTDGTTHSPQATPSEPPGSPDGLDTLAIDIGGTGLKASVLDITGAMEHDRVRIPTPYPLPPEKLVTVLTDLVKPLPHFDRISVGFPGMVRDGHVLSAPHFVSPEGPGGEPTPKLAKAWADFDLESRLASDLGTPCKVANDADLQGAAVVKGLELVLTLGTGLGSAFFKDGLLLPHLEFAHHPFRKGESYNDAIGDAARKKLGHKKWQKRVTEVVETFRALCFFDHCYLGGGNSAKLDVELPADVSVTDNNAGILGGIKLWERSR